MKVVSKLTGISYTVIGEDDTYWKNDLGNTLKKTNPIIYEEGDKVVVVKDWKDYPECFVTCVGRIGHINNMTSGGYDVAFTNGNDGWWYKHDEIAPYFGGEILKASIKAAVPPGNIVPVRKIRVLNP